MRLGGTLIYYAHNELENLCLDRATFQNWCGEQIGIRYAELVYDGMWFSPLREALQWPSWMKPRRPLPVP